ncbi:MAG: SoxR reducing system RseC family protein [Prevotellaceae bacterium]|jgi:sigma-E factor negative regulatory protein RseC|nr:SoxR reducing system RseC family protein [Prevotellaceae bacterium]
MMKHKVKFNDDSNIARVCRSGEVVEINPEHILVDIVSESACEACRAKSICSASEGKRKTLCIPRRESRQNLLPGDRVQVSMRMSTGLKAALLAYFLPAMVALAALLLLTEAGADELAAGAWSLGSLAVYYTALYMFRNKLNKQFTFSIEKID